ncbi:DNA binding domain-containing protein, excisionase family [Filomicrobium insigne]|uniref:DNA binding domain-containing protein, excisionase family n=1 Tax=Filomicrobium insigne TaxID=418854 RepID=A0A1H0HMZ0_9HYPH|nr:excisionase family DNA-binding protein [Filomicrobium insigne]SDO20549.1 DNA binding domain-containing protein, excisionase family [Filomicrobium insigne]
MTEKNAYSPAEICRRNGIGKTTLYAEIKAGRLEAIKVGRKTLITASAEQTWLTTLPRLSAQA